MGSIRLKFLLRDVLWLFKGIATKGDSEKTRPQHTKQPKGNLGMPPPPKHTTYSRTHRPKPQTVSHEDVIRNASGRDHISLEYQQELVERLRKVRDDQPHKSPQWEFVNNHLTQAEKKIPKVSANNVRSRALVERVLDEASMGVSDIIEEQAQEIRRLRLDLARKRRRMEKNSPWPSYSHTWTTTSYHPLSQRELDAFGRMQQQTRRYRSKHWIDETTDKHYYKIIDADESGE